MADGIEDFLPWLALASLAGLPAVEDDAIAVLQFAKERLQPGSVQVLKILVREIWLRGQRDEAAAALRTAAEPPDGESARALAAWAERLGSRIAAEAEELLLAGEAEALYQLLLYDPARLRREA